MDAAAAQEAFWSGVADQMPVIVGAAVTLVLAAFGWATRKLGEAARDAAADVERSKRGGVRLTPTEQMGQAVKKARNTLGVTGSLIPAAMIKARVQDVVDSAKAMEKAKSDPPPPPLARPSGEFRGIDFSAVDDIRDANETGDDDQ